MQWETFNVFSFRTSPQGVEEFLLGLLNRQNTIHFPIQSFVFSTVEKIGKTSALFPKLAVEWSIGQISKVGTDFDNISMSESLNPFDIHKIFAVLSPLHALFLRKIAGIVAFTRPLFSNLNGSQQSQSYRCSTSVMFC